MYICMYVCVYVCVCVCVCVFVCVRACMYYSQEKWLDKDTRSVKIRFIFYNGNIGSLA